MNYSIALSLSVTAKVYSGNAGSRSNGRVPQVLFCSSKIHIMKEFDFRKYIYNNIQWIKNIIRELNTWLQGF